ncbi:MAG: 1-acyl-sn-glycerol-3-phosphate acyltransferase [bacterium]|nr:1-acyl-sn-glycerol-3-phosphate acyltransferase [bacterium]
MTLGFRFFAFWVRLGGRVFYRARAVGRENVPRTGAFILAGNHVSYLDPPVFGAFANGRDVHFMAKQELFSKPILRWLLPVVNAFPVNREGSARGPLMASLKLLRAGQSVGLFPEGRRNLDGEQDARLGVAWLANAAQVPVVPCAIAGTRDAKPFRTRVRLAFGPSIPPPPGGGKATKESLASYTELVMNAIDALQKENDRRAD